MHLRNSIHKGGGGTKEHLQVSAMLRAIVHVCIMCTTHVNRYELRAIVHVCIMCTTHVNAIWAFYISCILYFQ
jgi:hypothetical protein